MANPQHNPAAVFGAVVDKKIRELAVQVCDAALAGCPVGACVNATARRDATTRTTVLVISGAIPDDLFAHLKAVAEGWSARLRADPSSVSAYHVEENVAVSAPKPDRN